MRNSCPMSDRAKEANAASTFRLNIGISPGILRAYRPRSSEKVGCSNLDYFAAAPTEHRFHHPKAEAVGLIELNFRRHRQLQGVRHHVKQRRTIVTEYSRNAFLQIC